MAFIENFRAIAQNKIPNNAPLKAPTPVWEQPQTSEETKEGWREAESRFNVDNLIRTYFKARSNEIAADNATLSDIASAQPELNLVFKNMDVIENRDKLLKVLDDVEAETTWDGKIQAMQNAYEKMNKSNGVTGWFNVLSDHLTSMQDQVQKYGTEIDPSYALNWMRNMTRGTRRPIMV